MGVEGVYICVRVFECVRERESEYRAEMEGGVSSHGETREGGTVRIKSGE